LPVPITCSVKSRENMIGQAAFGEFLSVAGRFFVPRIQRFLR
jgi:hypothetical protein